MSVRVQTVKEICEAALRTIGAFPFDMPEADPFEMDEAARRLDWLIAHKAAYHRNLHLIPDSITFAMTAGEEEYDLLDVMGATAPEQGVMYAINAFLVNDQNRVVKPLTLLRRREYDAIEDKTAEGALESIYIDRSIARPKLFVHRVQSASSPIQSIRLTFTRRTADATSQPLDDQHLDAPHEWSHWAATALAAIICNGPVRQVPDGEVDMRVKDAEKLWTEILGFSDQEQASEPRRVAYRDF